MNTGYDWEKLYHLAVLEADWTKIEDRIYAAESAMRTRLHEFSMNHGGPRHENQAIADVLERLDVLRKEVIAWQESNGLSLRSSRSRLGLEVGCRASASMCPRIAQRI